MEAPLLPRPRKHEWATIETQNLELKSKPQFLFI